MASDPILTVLDQSHVQPPPATIADRSLSLTFFDFLWLVSTPVHHLFFYDHPITQTQFIQTVVPNLKTSLSITLQHFFPFAGNLIIFPSPKKPEIRYAEGDSVAVTFAECSLDFNDLTANHPRECEKFYHLIPTLGQSAKVSDYVKIPVFSVQVTLFPGHGIAIGMTNHHSLGDASSRISFLKAWTSIARSGNDKSFLANETNFPFYDRVVNYPKQDENLLKRAKIETFYEGYQPPSLSGPTDKSRVTVVLTRTVVDRLKKMVKTHLPELAYVSSFTVACGYIWSCIAKSRNDELQLFALPINYRSRMDPPLPAAYFGNCVWASITIAKTRVLTGDDGFVNAAKLLGESLQETLRDKDVVWKDSGESFDELLSKEMPTTFMGVAGTPKIRFYDLDFGWGMPRKHETISIDYNGSISMNACKESNEDLEIGVCLSATEMEAFVGIFEDGLKACI